MTATKYRPALEAALVRQLCKSLPAVLGGRGLTCTLHREVVVGGTIADIVAALQSEDTRKRVPRALSATESVVLSVLRSDGALTCEDLALRTGLNGKTTSIVARLSSQGLIVPANRRRLTARTRTFCACKLIAIEAKLVRWREALDQAIAYRSYADEAYVALPEGFSRPALAASKHFREAGVGLLVVSNRAIRKAIAAARGKDHDWRREFVYSRLTTREGGLERTGSPRRHPKRPAA